MPLLVTSDWTACRQTKVSHCALGQKRASSKTSKARTQVASRRPAMRADIMAALAAAGFASIDTRFIELAGSGVGGDYSYRAGPCKRVKSAAQHKREAVRRKNKKKHGK